MGSVILEISLCIIENTLFFLFLNSLLTSKFNSIILLVIVILIYSFAGYFCSTLNILLRIPLAIALSLLGTSFLYTDKFIVKLTYVLISLYSLYIIDIIIGNTFSLILDKEISDIFFSNIFYRLIICLTIKAVDAIIYILLYKMLYKTNINMRTRFWVLFSIVAFVFLAISAVFLQFYPTTYQELASTVLYTSLAVLFLAMSLIIIYFFTELSKGFQLDSKLFLLENSFSALQEQITVQQQSSENVRKLRHDMKNHLTNIRSLIDNGEISDAVTLLDKTAGNINLVQTEEINTGNNFVDIIILSKMSLCREKNIDFSYSVQPLGNINIDVVDLSSLLSNLLDNAVESAVQTAKPFIRLTLMKYNAYYTICVENSYKGKEYIQESAGTLLTTKLDQALHGYGTQIISDIAQKYDGCYSWEAQENKFVSTVLIKI